MDRPSDEPILVALKRLRRCPEEVGDECWPPAKWKRHTQKEPTACVATKSTQPQSEEVMQVAAETMPADGESGQPGPLNGMGEPTKDSVVRIPEQQETTLTGHQSPEVNTGESILPPLFFETGVDTARWMLPR